MSPHSSCETSPLLPSSTATQDDSTSKPQGRKIATSRRLILALPYVIVFLVIELSMMVVETSLYPIQEAIICQKYFPVSAVDANADPRCKSEIVQAELSLLKGWQLTISLLPGMITAIPYGMVAEAYGHRFVLALSTFGIALTQACYVVISSFPDTFPLRLTWLCACFSIIGGGVYVNAAMTYTIAADFSTGAERSTVFFYISAIALVGKLVGSPLTYAAMSRGNWFAVYTGMGFSTGATLATFFLPSTDNIKPVESRDADCSPVGDGSLPHLKTDYFDGVKKAAALIQTMFWENKQLGMLLSTFLFTSLGKSVPIILMQYMTKRFQWTWAETNLLYSITAIIEISMVTLVLPSISQALMKHVGLAAASKDLWLARAGLICLTVGVFGMGLASTSIFLIISLVVCALGFGSDPAMRGLLVTMAEGKPASLLFTIMSVLECLGLLISGPLLATTFRIGMEWEGAWIGLPFISAGCFLACATAITIGVRVGEKPIQGLDGVI